MRWPWQRHTWRAQGVLSAAFTGDREARYSPTYWPSRRQAKAFAERLRKDHGPGMLARVEIEKL